MKVKFWGVRGSVPCPPSNQEIRAKLRAALERSRVGFKGNPDRFLDDLPQWITGLVGGNTACLEVSDHDDLLIFDSGTGIKNLGHQLVPSHISELFEQFYVTERLPVNSLEPPEGPVRQLNLFMTHTHWDHIQGFPFFRPAYVPYYHIDIYGADRNQIKEAFTAQQNSPYLFPVPIDFMKAAILFHDFPAEGLTVGQFKIDSLPLPHPGGTLAYRIKKGRKTVVFATDYEYEELGPLTEADPKHLATFIKDADVFISDTQYTYLDHKTKEGWGHSNALSVVEMAAKAGVKKFFLFHHDPNYSDEKLYDMLDKTRAYTRLLQKGPPMDIHLATEETVVKL
ncbi:MAG: MBL fold metallo-hydrolase [Deltaproteobacteria bacterium]|jgi:phosphoribosyl 1,2-cyclic phosphodiesterase|nr:MBL fold metallo-hydrolase [Deltaproteobacteria bacterium]